jgi:transposase
MAEEFPGRYPYPVGGAAVKRFVEGECRAQAVLFPERLDDWIGEDNPVRAVDAFAGELDFKALGFEGAEPANTGRPAYHPATLLKIYIYGYLNRVQSSRRLEREAQRNVELMWLTQRLAPDFKTIADFRRDNGPAIRQVCVQFVRLCRQLGLFEQTLVAIDGSKFKAVNNRDRNFTPRKLEARKQQLETSVERYLAELDRADRDPALVPEERVEHLKEKIAKVRAQMQVLDAIDGQLAASPDGQVSLTDPDARSMATSGRGTGIVGYNVQASVDAKNHLIVTHEVTNVGHDRTQLASMAEKTQDAIGSGSLTVLADRGYYKGPELLKCEDAGIDAIVPKPLTSNSKADGRFDKRDFVYDSEGDEYRCPAGERAIWRFSTVEDGMTLHKYWSSACPKCLMRSACTTSKYRRIGRWEREEVFDRVQQRLDQMPDAGRIRRQTVEHTFGTLKAWMGATHFLTKTLPRVRTEMSLHVLAYNLKRVMQMIGVRLLIQALRTC